MLTPRPPPWYARVASVKRSQTTQSPRASAGRIRLSRWTLRAANMSSVSACGVIVLVAAIQHDLAHSLGKRRAAGLARHDHGHASCAQTVAHHARDGRFARPFDAFERDEQAFAHGSPGVLARGAALAGCASAQGTASRPRCVPPASSRSSARRCRRPSRRNTARRSPRAAPPPTRNRARAARWASEAGRRACRCCTACRSRDRACGCRRRTARRGRRSPSDRTAGACRCAGAR